MTNRIRGLRLRPTMVSRTSASTISGSKYTASGSRKTVAASRNSTPCFAKFSSAFVSSQLKLSPGSCSFALVSVHWHAASLDEGGCSREKPPPHGQLLVGRPTPEGSSGHKDPQLQD